MNGFTVHQSCAIENTGEAFGIATAIGLAVWGIVYLIKHSK